MDSFINDVDTDPDPGSATAGLDPKKLKTDFFPQANKFEIHNNKIIFGSKIRF